MPLFLVALTATLVINEICYDPDGADGGREFVELWNSGPQQVSLAGMCLEFANGAQAPQWSTRWEATALDSLSPGATYLVVDRGWQGVAADAEVTLGLQNGPDALRLRGLTGVLDLVGWGDLEHSELAEGQPALDVSGETLARRPDGHDTDDNADDFVSAQPTPGAPNWRRFAPALASIVWNPPSLGRAGESAQAMLQVSNDGLETIAGASLQLQVSTAIGSVTLPSLPPEGAATVTVDIVPNVAGTWPVTVRFLGTSILDTLTCAAGGLQVGLSDLRLVEVMADPVAGGEWCEIANLGSVPRNLIGLWLRDEDGAWRELPDIELVPGDHQLLVQDLGQMQSWLDALARGGQAPACLVQDPHELAGWPSLNNTAPASRSFADRLYLGDAEGLVLDHATLGAGNGTVTAGRSLERGHDAVWAASTAPAGGTPGCPQRLGPEVASGHLTLAPNPFDPLAGDGAVLVTFTVPPTGTGWEGRLYDLWGQLVRNLGGDDLGPGPRDVRWDGHDLRGEVVPGGGYVLAVGWRQGGGGLEWAHRRLVVVRGADR